MKSIEDFVKMKRATADPTLVSVYRHSITNEEFEMVHPTAEHKRRVDAKHAAHGTLIKR